MWDITRQFQFRGISSDTINIKSTKTSDAKSCWFLWQISALGREHSKSIFNSGECLMTETTECKTYCVNFCIQKQCQSNYSVNQVSKCIVILGTIGHWSIIKSNKWATPWLKLALGMRRLSNLKILRHFTNVRPMEYSILSGKSSWFLIHFLTLNESIPRKNISQVHVGYLLEIFFFYFDVKTRSCPGIFWNLTIVFASKRFWRKIPRSGISRK